MQIETEFDRNRVILEEMSIAYMAPRGYAPYRRPVCPKCVFPVEAMKLNAGVYLCPCGNEIRSGEFLEPLAFSFLRERRKSE